MLFVVETRSLRGPRDMRYREGPDYSKTDSHSRHCRGHKSVMKPVETQVQGLYGVKTQPSLTMGLRSCRGDPDTHQHASSMTTSHCLLQNPRVCRASQWGIGAGPLFSCFTPQPPSRDGPQVLSSGMTLALAILQRSQKCDKKEQTPSTAVV